MMRTALLTCLILGLMATSGNLIADDKEPSGEPQRYLLRYTFQPGQTIRWKVSHVASTETKIQGDEQRSRSSSVSTKVWEITNVAENGNITFVHSVEDVEMWQKVTDQDEITYNSKTDKEPPLIYQPVAETVGVPMYVVTVDPRGDIIKRESHHKQTENSQIGLEQITILMPEKSVKVGSNWHSPGELRIRTDEGMVKRVKIRRLYTLKKVHAGLATIAVKTEVLTPIRDEKIKLHLLQRLNKGTIKFDLDAGMILSRQMDWDETIVGFNGAESMMHYLARITEDHLPKAKSTARKAKTAEPSKNTSARRKTPSTAGNDSKPKPKLRR